MVGEVFVSPFCYELNLSPLFILSFHSESFEKKDLDFNTAAGTQAFGDSVMSKRHRELAEPNLRSPGSSSAWCSAHKGSAAAGRMFEDHGLLRFGSARNP